MNLHKREPVHTPRTLAEWVEHFDFINEERWGDDDEDPPSWEEVRDKHLTEWRIENMTYEFWHSYVTSTIIEEARRTIRKLKLK